ncbi:MAG TPA: hypothetical protein VMT30_03915 [Candidatus Saccharimonadia bacterium]|nr:hypothetical protein [Candidatus Saccharimonadia bacterium]
MAVLVAVVGFMLLGTGEILVSGVQSHGSLVAADGIHNLMDALVLCVAYLIEEALATSRHPFVRGGGQKITRLLLGVSAPAAYAGGLVTQSDLTIGMIEPGGRETSLLFLLGFGSLVVNVACYRLTHCHGHVGLSAHLLADTVGAVAIMVAALAVPYFARAAGYIGVAALCVMVQVTLRELGPTGRALWSEVATSIGGHESGG